MSIKVRMRIGGRWVSVSALLDSGAEVNMVHPKLLGTPEFNRLENHTQVSALFNAKVMPFGSCDILNSVTDDYAATEQRRSRFVVADIGDLDVIFGFPWLEDTDPIISWRRRTFVFPYNPQAIKLCVTKKELRRAANEASHIMLILAHPFVDDVESAAKEPRVLPEEFQAFAPMFSLEKAAVLPAFNKHAHQIDLEGETVPPAGPIYPLAEPELEVLRAYIDDALATGRIRYSRSPAGAPVLFVPKKGGQLRLCVDYRALNKLTKKNRAPLPLISEILDRLSKAKRYTKLDLKDAYYRLRIREGDEWKTAFRCRYGHFEYNVMPFGLVNAPATFQTFINEVLGDLVDTICIAYLDDILIYSEDAAEHSMHVRHVLERLQQYDLYLNLEKCEFNVDRVSFLGFVIDPTGIHMEGTRISAILQWPVPKSVKDIQIFLGFTGFYRRFVRNYSKVTAPLTDLLKGSGGTTRRGKAGTTQHPFHLSSRGLEAFMKLKVLFTRAPFLHHYEPELPTRVECDASAFAIGAILSQLKGGRWHPVAFMSRKLKGAELRYDTPDAELMAIIDAFRVWRPYLAYVQEPIKVMTDHLNHRYLATKPKLSARQARWMEELAVFDFVIEYREGKKNPADGLSRRPDLRDSSEVEEARRVPLTGFLERFMHMRGLQDISGVSGIAVGRPDKAPWREALVATVRTLFSSLSFAETVVLARVDEDSVADQIFAPSLGTTGPLAGFQAGGCPSEVGQVRAFDDPETYHRDTGGPDRIGESPWDTLWHGRPGPYIRVGRRGQRNREEDAASTAEGTDREPSPSTSVSLHRELPVKMTLETAPLQLLPPLTEAVHSAQQRDVFVTNEQWKKWRSSRDPAGSHWGYSGIDPLLRFKGRAYIPPEHGLRREVLKLFHDSPTAGHQGVTKTFKRISAMFFWQSLSKDVRKYVSTCVICQRTKARTHLPYGELASLPVPTSPWKEISMDFIVKLPHSRAITGKSCDAILVVVDRFTKYALYIPTTERITSDGLATLLLHHVYRLFGIPDGIVSDRGSLFTSRFWTSLCWALSTSRRLSTAFHPQTDGQTERVNQSVEHYLRTFCCFEQNDWAERLYLAEFVYNTSWHSATRTTPAKALFGFDPRGPNDIPTQGPKPSKVPAAEDRAKQLRDSREEIVKILQHAQALYKKWYDKGRKKITFAKGDWVYISTKHLRRKRPARKFADKYLGPYQIEKVIGHHGLAYKLRLPSSARIHTTFPISSLEPHRPRDSEPPASPTDNPFVPNETFEVETILDHKGKSSRRQYLIKWKGYDETENSWEPRRNIDDGPLLQEYEERLQVTANER